MSTTTNLPNKSLVVIVGSLAAAALFNFTPTQEGRVLKTYKDIAGVLTYCDGATENAIWGKVYTPAECNAQLERDLTRHAEGIERCGVPLARMTDGQKVAFVDTAYNIGIANFCDSSMARLSKAGDMPGACRAVLAWDGINKKIKQPDGTFKKVHIQIRGVVLRRQRVYDFCMKGLPT